MPRDVNSLLDACQKDQITVLGWELWLVDHQIGTRSNNLRPAPGHWSGLIPVRSSDLPAVVQGSGDADTIREQIAKLDLDELVEIEWLQYVRVNVTLGDNEKA